MRSHVVTALLIAVAAAFIASSPASPQPYNTEVRAGRAFFEMSITQRFSEEGKPLLVVKTAIPYRRLVFLETALGYESTYRILMSLLDEDGDHIRGDVWEEMVTVEKYADTKSAAKVSTSQRSIPIEGGTYKVKVILEIVDSKM